MLKIIINIALITITLVYNCLSQVSDTSDSRWSIVMPVAGSRDVDMRNTCIGISKDSTIYNFVMNTGTYPVFIQDIKITGPNETEFSLMKPFVPVTIDVNKSIPLEFRFLPSGLGIRKADIIIYTQSDTLIQEITGTSTDKLTENIIDIISFGKVELNKFSDTSELIFKNKSNNIINISRIINLGPDYSQFQILEGGDSFSLQPGEKHILKARFFPKESGRTSCLIEFQVDGDCFPTHLQLYGEGYSTGPSIDVSNILFKDLICESSDLDTLIIKNTGKKELCISDIVVSGIDFNSFSIKNKIFPDTIQPETTKQYEIIFTPLKTGLSSASLTIISNAIPDSLLILELTGNKENITISAPDTIDLGKICVNSQKDTTIILSNSSSINTKFNYNLSSGLITILNPDIFLNEFSKAESRNLNIRFIGSSQTGLYFQNLNIIDSCGNMETITIKEDIIETSLEFNREIIFNETGTGVTLDTIILIKNTGNQTIEITNIILLNNLIFKLENNYRKVILPDDTIQLKISVNSDNTGKYNDIIYINIEKPCAVTDSINISVEVLDRFKTLVWLPEVYSTPGSILKIPLHAKITEGNIQLADCEFYTKIKFDAQAFLPDEPDAGYIDNSIRYLEIHGFPVKYSDGSYLLTEIEGMTLLGNKYKYDLEIEEFEWCQNTISTDKINGILNISSFCAEKLRGVQLFTPTSMEIFQNDGFPDNSDDLIEIKILSEEKGMFLLRIYSMQGIEIEKYGWLNNDNKEINKIININPSKLFTGAYFVILKSPEKMLTKKLLIIR
jgi:hypothetical protein